MNRWAARRPFSVWIGLLLTALVWAGAIWAGLQLSEQLQGSPRSWPLTPSVFGLFLITLFGFALGVVLLYRSLSALTLSYRVDRNAITIGWLGNQGVVPMDRIQAVEIGVPPGTKLPWFGARSFGYQRGQGRLASGQSVYLFATGALHNAVLIHLPNSSYVITPKRRDAFVQEVEGRRSLGIVQGQSEGVIRTKRVSYPFWTDKLVRVSLALGLLFNLLLWGLISTRYTVIAQEISLRFDVTGASVALFPREQILALPLIGLLTWLVNTAISLMVYRSSRAGSLLLLAGSSVIQLLLAVAIAHIMLNA